jgi:sulfoxide reductase catalytic subunit YedY
MLIKTDHSGFDHAIPSDITPQGVYHQRRNLIKLMATGAAGATIASWAGRDAMAQAVVKPGKLAALPGAKSGVTGAVTMEKVTDYKDVTSYNNFYEFGTDKSDPAKNAHTLVTRPWTVAIEGLVKQPRT